MIIDDNPYHHRISSITKIIVIIAPWSDSSFVIVIRSAIIVQSVSLHLCKFPIAKKSIYTSNYSAPYTTHSSAEMPVCTRTRCLMFRNWIDQRISRPMLHKEPTHAAGQWREIPWDGTMLWDKNVVTMACRTPAGNAPEFWVPFFWAWYGMISKKQSLANTLLLKIPCLEHHRANQDRHSAHS